MAFTSFNLITALTIDNSPDMKMIEHASKNTFTVA